MRPATRDAISKHPTQSESANRTPTSLQRASNPLEARAFPVAAPARTRGAVGRPPARVVAAAVAATDPRQTRLQLVAGGGAHPSHWGLRRGDEDERDVQARVRAAAAIDDAERACKRARAGSAFAAAAREYAQFEPAMRAWLVSAPLAVADLFSAASSAATVAAVAASAADTAAAERAAQLAADGAALAQATAGADAHADDPAPGAAG